MGSLIELAREAQHLLSLLEDSGGEITPELEYALELNRADLTTKAEAYAHLLDRIPAVATYWKQQRDQAAKVAQGLALLEERLKDHIKAGMLTMGVTKLEGESVKFSISPSKPALVVGDVPPEYLITVTTLAPDKERIRADLEAGIEVPGAELVQGVTLRRSKRRALE